MNEKVADCKIVIVTRCGKTS